mmetsp:Transcript_34278/g.47854  ORF Transcript_34278/g.47854 Transcript_34278/m.47854 type:complete len:212 (-) Transcript_34278:383-1018(-)
MPVIKFLLCEQRRLDSEPLLRPKVLRAPHSIGNCVLQQCGEQGLTEVVPTTKLTLDVPVRAEQVLCLCWKAPHNIHIIEILFCHGCIPRDHDVFLQPGLCGVVPKFIVRLAAASEPNPKNMAEKNCGTEGVSITSCTACKPVMVVEILEDGLFIQRAVRDAFLHVPVGVENAASSECSGRQVTVRVAYNEDWHTHEHHQHQYDHSPGGECN